LSFDLKDSSGICIVFNSTGSEFHNVGPERAKLRGPIRTVRVGGTARFPWAAVHTLLIDILRCVRLYVKWKYYYIIIYKAAVY